MAYFEWTDKLDLGVDDMNNEHKELIRIMNKLYDRNSQGASKMELQNIISELAAYTVKHFSDEEKYMESIEFPDLKQHKLVHKNLLEKLGSFKENFDANEEKVGDDFFNFLKLWLAAHIQGIDMKYGKFSQSIAA